MKKVIIVVLMVAIVATMFTGCASQVEGTVVSCEESHVITNSGMKTMSTYYMAKGDYAKSVMYDNISKIETQVYDVVVEYEGIQYTIETQTEYEAGETILFYLPNN